VSVTGEVREFSRAGVVKKPWGWLCIGTARWRSNPAECRRRRSCTDTPISQRG